MRNERTQRMMRCALERQSGVQNYVFGDLTAVTLALKHHYAESFWRQLSLSDTCSKTYVHFYPSMPRPDRYPSMTGPDRYPSMTRPDRYPIMTGWNVLVTPVIRPYDRCQAARGWF